MAAGTVNPFEGQPKVGDFFAPFFTVRFLTADSTPAKQIDDTSGTPVETNVNAAGEVIVSQGNTEIRFSEDNRTSQFRSFATRLTITNQGGGANFAELVFEPPFEDAKKMIDLKLLQFNSIMVVQWGYTSNSVNDTIISDTHYFVIQQPKLEMHGTDVTLTVTGVDMFAYSAMKREDRRTFDRRLYNDDDILDAIAGKNNFRTNYTLTTAASLIHQNKPLSKDEPPSIEQNEKDWVFFGRICDMNDCAFFTIGNTIFIVDQNIAKVQLTSYRLLFFMQPTDARDIPMYTFSTQALPQLFFPAESKEVKATHHDLDMGQDKTNTHEPTKMADQVQLGQRTAAGKDEADGRSIPIAANVTVIPNPEYLPTETGKHFSVPAGQANRDEFAKRVVRDAEIMANTNADCTIPGVPHIVPQQLVRVEGVSKTFSGVYMVLKVVHRLSTDGYDCDLTLIRDSSTGDPVVGKGEKPATGGSDPKQTPGGEAAQSQPAEDPKTGKSTVPND